MLLAQLFVYLFYGYLLLGLLFAVWFVSGGVNRLTGHLRGADWQLRLILLPASAALWPVLLQKILKNR